MIGDDGKKLLTCPICAGVRWGSLSYRLYDKDGKAAGNYCSAKCAHADAWGPRFRPYKVRKI
jgi:hypothetical protein